MVCTAAPGLWAPLHPNRPVVNLKMLKAATNLRHILCAAQHPAVTGSPCHGGAAWGLRLAAGAGRVGAAELGVNHH